MAGKAEFEDRYRKEFLSGEQFHRIDRYREEMMDLLELPGAGRILGGLIWLLRSPYRWTRDYVAGLIVRPEVYNLSEPTVLNAGLNGWLDKLQTEALRRAPHAPVLETDRGAVRFGTRPAGPRAVRPGAPRVRVKGNRRTGDRPASRSWKVWRRTPFCSTHCGSGSSLFDVVLIGIILYLTWVPELVSPAAHLRRGVDHAPGDGTGRSRRGGIGSLACSQPAGSARRDGANESARRLALVVARDRRFGYRETATGSAPRAGNDPPTRRTSGNENRTVGNRPAHTDTTATSIDRTDSLAGDRMIADEKSRRLPTSHRSRSCERSPRFSAGSSGACGRGSMRAGSSRSRCSSGPNSKDSRTISADKAKRSTWTARYSSSCSWAAPASANRRCSTRSRADRSRRRRSRGPPRATRSSTFTTPFGRTGSTRPCGSAGSRSTTAKGCFRKSSSIRPTSTRTISPTARS